MKKTLRKSIGILLVLVMLISTLSALSFTASAADAYNLLLNGDFETGTMGYHIEKTNFPAATVTTIDDNTRPGKVLCIESGAEVLNSKYHTFVVYQSVPVEANTDYTWDFYIQPTAEDNHYIGVVAGNTVSITGNTTLPLTANVIQGDITFTANAIPAGAQLNTAGAADPNWLQFKANWNWKQVRISFNSGNNTNICLAYTARAAGRRVLFDDWSLYKSPAVGKVVNGNFNNGDLLGYYGTAATMDVVADPANPANMVLHAFGPGYVRQAVKVEKNTDYVLSFRHRKAGVAFDKMYTDVYAADGTTQLATKVENVQNPNSALFAEFWSGRPFINSQGTTWNIIRINFNSGDNETVFINFDLYNENRGDRYIDDICLYEEPAVGELINGSFDDGTDGYTNDNAADFKVIKDPNNSTNNILYVKGGNSAGGAATGTYYQNVYVEKNTDYIWKFKMKHAGANGATRICINDAKNATPITPTSIYNTTNGYSKVETGFAYVDAYNGAWVEFTVMFNSGENASVNLFHNAWANSREIYMDDWSLTKAPAVGEFTNAGFENGKADYVATEKVIATTETENVHSGSKALKLEGTPNGAFGHYFYKEIAVEKNTDYVWSFYFNSATANTKLVGVANFEGTKLLPSFLRTDGFKSPEDITFTSLRDTSNVNWHETLYTGGWVKYSVIFNSGDNAYVRLCIDMINQARSGITDDWSLSKYYFTQGDANNDGTIDSLDLTSVRKEILGSAPEYYKTGADYNGDGKVGLVDLVKLKKALLLTDLEGYELVWADDFNGEYLDNTKWTKAQHMSAQDDLELRYDETGINVDDGSATLYAGRVDSDSYYTNASLTTCNRDASTHLMSFKYGYVEMRAKIPFGAPAFPSFWMKSVIENNAHGEIDIFEHFSETGDTWIQSGIHKWYLDDAKTHLVNNAVNGINVPADGDWHTYGLLWTPEKLEFKLDGKTYHTIDISANWGSYKKYTAADSEGEIIEADNEIFHDYYYLIMNNYMNTPARVGNVDYAANENSELPLEYEIDYVRLYQNSDGEIRTGALQ